MQGSKHTAAFDEGHSSGVGIIDNPANNMSWPFEVLSSLVLPSLPNSFFGRAFLRGIRFEFEDVI